MNNNNDNKINNNTNNNNIKINIDDDFTQAFFKHKYPKMLSYQWT